MSKLYRVLMVLICLLTASPVLADIDPVARLTANAQTNDHDCYPDYTDASVRLCYLQAQASGVPTTIHLPATEIDLKASLPLVPNVRTVGVTPEIYDPMGHVQTGSLVDNWDFVGGAGQGTLLKGDGTFPAFTAQTTSQNGANWDNAFVTGATFQDVGFTNFTTAFLVGGTNAAGPAYLQLHNVYINHVQDGFLLTNPISMGFDGVFVDRVSNSCGQLIADVPTQQYEPGNMTLQRMQCTPGNTLSVHGWLVKSTAGSVFGTLNFRMIQVDAVGGSTHGESVTVTSGSSSLPVAHLEDYPVGAIIQASGTTVGTGASAITATQYYAVLSQSGASGAGTITIATRRAGAVIVPNASGSITLTNNGWPLLDVQGGGTAGSYTGSITGSYFGGIDLEGQAGQPLMYVENAGTSYLQFNAGAGDTAVFRNSYNATLESTQLAFKVDADNFMYYRGYLGAALNKVPYGTYCNNALGTCGTFMGDQSSYAQGGSIQLTNPSGGSFGLAGTPLGIHAQAFSGSSFTLGAAECGEAIFNATSASLTLPTIQTSGASQNTGCVIRAFNNQSTALQVTTNSGQTFNGVAGSTTLWIPAHSEVDFTAPTATTYWVVTAPVMAGVTQTSSTIGTCTAGGEGITASVSDGSASPTYGAAYSGGGSTHQTVSCLNAAWTYH